MGTALVKLKIMPVSPEVDLEAIKNQSKEILEGKEAKNISFEEEPVAFGLKAILLGFSMDESNELESIEESLKKVENVNSVQVVDMRRAFG